MTKEKLINQHILEYESRLKHIKELFKRANEAADAGQKDAAAKVKLDKFAETKAQLEEKLEAVKAMDLKHWREETVSQSGPMAIWDILAQQLEDFVEHHENTEDSAS